MSQDKQVHKLFAQPIFQYKVDNYEKHNEDLKKYIYDLYEKDKVGIKSSKNSNFFILPYCFFYRIFVLFQQYQNNQGL